MTQINVLPETDRDDPTHGRRRRIRVLSLIKGLGRGGAELLLLHAAELRNRAMIEYEAAYLVPWKNTLVGDLETQDVPVHLLDMRREFDLRWAGKLRALLKEQPFDIVHVHSPYVASIARLVLRTLPRARRPHLISTEHVPWHGYSLPTRILNALTFPLDDAHLAVSQAVCQSIPAFLRQDVTLLVHGIPIDRTLANLRLRSDVRRELGIAPHEVLVGTVANFRAQKGYPDLLEAARLVIQRGVDNVRFAAVGQGPMEQTIRALHQQLDLGDRFLLVGPKEQGAAFVAACDMFVLASLYEGLSLALMEAMTLGLPIVATRVEGIAELIDEGTEGILVPASRPDRLADSIIRLARDPELRQRLGRAAADSAHRFDNRKAVAAIENLYQRLANGRH